MGDRATLQIRESKAGGWEGVEIYTHWGGQSSLIEALAKAIERAPDRLTDPSYFTRIVISILTKGYEKENTGFGVWALGSQETEYGLFAFNVDTQTIETDDNIFTPKEFVQWAKLGTTS